MVPSTTPVLEGKTVSSYFGVVTREEILGANGILGIDIDYETVGGSMLIVSISGT